MVKKVKEFFGKKFSLATLACLALVMAMGTSAMAAPGDPIEFTGVSLPFSVSSMMTTAVNFIMIYGEWILIVLAVLFSPVLYGLVMRLVAYIGRRQAVK